MIFCNRIKVEIDRYYDDKYHGRIATGQEVGVLVRRSILHPWRLESGDLGAMLAGDKFTWFRLKLGTYDPFGKFTVTVSPWEKIND
jgi:hypothetical protein